jgi:hypothetical protein|nr:MAG TPA: hypothetical protein [Caudoviricetes sp.]
MGQETQGQPAVPPVEGGVVGAPSSENRRTGPHAIRLVTLQPQRPPTELLRDLLITGGYSVEMASKVGTEAHNEIRLTEVEAKEMQYGNTELTVTFSGETKDELAKHNTLIDGDKFKHAYNRLSWEQEVKRITAEFVGDESLGKEELDKQKANYEVDGYHAVSLLLVEKVQKVADIFAHDLFPYGSTPMRADEIDVKDNVFKGLGTLTTVMGKRFIGTTEHNVNINPIAFSMEKPGIGLFEFSAPFVQLDMLKWFYTGVSNVERKAFIVFDLGYAGKSVSYERTVRRVPQIGRFTYFGEAPTLSNNGHGDMAVAEETTAEPLNIPLETTEAATNTAFAILMANNIVMYNNQYGKPFDRLADHIKEHVDTLQNIGFSYDDVEEGIEATPELVEAVANIPGYEDTTNLSSRVVGLAFRNDIPLSQAYANRSGVVGNWIIPVEKANLANELVDVLKSIADLKEKINGTAAVEGVKDVFHAASYTGDANQDIAIIVKTNTDKLEVDDSKHNKIKLTVGESDFLPYVKHVVNAVFGNVYGAVDIVEDTEYVYEHAKVYEVKPKAMFTNISVGKTIRVVYVKAEEAREESPAPKQGELVTELSGFTPPNSGQMV